jgi:hypothetical protein
MGLCRAWWSGFETVWANPERKKRNNHGHTVDEAAVAEKIYAK